jgi:anti-sigma B factor antagonist
MFNIQLFCYNAPSMPDTLEIQKANGSHPGQRVLRLLGALSLQTVPDFLKVARAETSPVLLIEFSGVTFVDSAGVGALLQTMASMNKASRKLGLAAVGQRTLAVLEITRVISLFNVYPSLAEAEEKLT